MTAFSASAGGPVDLVLSRLEGVKRSGSEYAARCPAHDDRKQSLSIGEGRDGKCVLDCKAGCDPATIVDKLGLAWSDLFPPKAQNVTQLGQRIAEYDYTNAHGTLLYQAVRFEPKDFRQRRPDPDRPGHYLWDLKGVERVLYRLPELLEAVQAGQTIYIAEGEKDVNNLRKLGLAATCNVMGAGKWQPAYNERLRGADVVILPDYDEAGLKHGQQIATSLQGIAKSVKIVKLPGLPEKGDVSDWLKAGGARDQLEDLAAAAQPWTPPGDTSADDETPTRTWLTEAELYNLPPPSWLVDQEIAANGITVLYGPSGGGKTFVALDYAMRVAGATGPVLYLAAEDVHGIALRARTWREFHQTTDGDFITWPEEVNLLNPAEVDRFIEEVQGLGLKLVIIDTLHQCLIGGSDSNDKDMGILIYACKRIQRATGAAPLLIHHTGKNGSGERGSSALRAAAYTMLELANEDGLIRMTCDKAKNSTPFPDRYMRLFETGGSCVVLPADSVMTTKAASLTKTQLEVLSVLDYAVFENIGTKSKQIGEATGIPAGTLWRTLSTLKRLHYVEQSAKGDPYYLTDEGRAKLAAASTLTSNTAHSNGQLSQLSPNSHQLSESSHSTLSHSHHPIGVRDESRSEREDESSTESTTNHEKITRLKLMSRRFIAARKLDDAKRIAREIGKLSNTDYSEIQAEISEAEATS